MKIPKTFPLIGVHWRDAWHSTQEVSHEDLGDLVDLWEVGFLVKDTENAVVLAMEADNQGYTSSRCVLTIPKVNIVEIFHLSPRKVKIKTQDDGLQESSKTT